MGKGLPEQKLDGRFEDEERVILWGTHYDRAGRSSDYQFKGSIEGEQGSEKLTGRARFFEKSYDFEAERAD
jgi:hypothetical protein